MPAREFVGRHIGERIEASDRAQVLEALASLRTGTIDFLRAHPRGVGAGGRVAPVIAWVVALEVGARRVALVAWEEADRLPSPASAEVLERTIAIALADASGAVKAVTLQRTIDDLTIDDLLAMRLRPADDRQRLGVRTDPAGVASEGVSFGGRVEIRTTSGRSVSLQVVYTALIGSTDRLILLMLPYDATAREAKLEEHLQRIAAEIEASGILLRAASLSGVALARLPEVSMLSPRQWEVLRRLASGQRVATIAAELFISQSTVRNHLSAIFDRFGVHSQAELLERLSQSDAASS
jgi:DNA-binding CsgD family transcriptional regulator